VSHAKSFAESDRHARITETRPNTSDTAFASHVKIGTIASGEKVIDSDSYIRRLKKQHKNLIAVAMEGSGAATPATYFGSCAGDILEIRGISDLADGTKSDDWQPYAADAAAAFLAAFLAEGPISSRETIAAARRATSRPFRAIRAESMAPINPTDILELLRRSGATEIADVHVDLHAFAQRGGKMGDVGGAVRSLTADDGTFMKALSSGGIDHLAFYGHLHVPLAVLAGALATDRISIKLFDFHRTANPPGWAWPRPEEEPFPSLNAMDVENPEGTPTDAVLGVSVSYSIEPELTAKVIAQPRFAHDLRVAKPVIDIVQSEIQARTYAGEVRRSLDVLAATRPRLARIHLFYAGPVSVAFAIGQAYSPTIHPPVIVWNHRSGTYDWGLNLSLALDGEEAIIEPTDFPSESK